MNVSYVGAAFDYSGYGECTRHDVASLITAGLEVNLQAPHYTNEPCDFGMLTEIMRNAESSDITYDKRIVHTTPDQFGKYMEQGKYNIGRCIWETDKLPPIFAENCEKMDELWTASEDNAQAIRNSGVTKPVYVIPEAVDVTLDPKTVKPYKTKADGKFTFYSIFEWTERKNPDALLRAYWTEFGRKDNVALVIKTYLDNFSVANRLEISQAIGAIKSSLKLDYYAPVYMYRELMQRDQVYRFHKSFNCFISTHRGEGWGIPQMEAMLMGKPIISTGYCGIHEYISDRIDGLLIPYNMKPVENTRNKQWYLPDQNWADVDLTDVRERMRYMYDHQAESVEIGKRARATVIDKFSYKTVGNLMKERLES